MNKAVLIMDMPEQVCQKCTLCYETEDDEYLCCAAGKLVPDGEKPDCSPIGGTDTGQLDQTAIASPAVMRRGGKRGKDEVYSRNNRKRC